jgi:hypothetical protein
MLMKSAACSERILTLHSGCAVSTEYVCEDLFFRRCGLSGLIQ